MPGLHRIEAPRPIQPLSRHLSNDVISSVNILFLGCLDLSIAVLGAAAILVYKPTHMHWIAKRVEIISSVSLIITAISDIAKSEKHPEWRFLFTAKIVALSFLIFIGKQGVKYSQHHSFYPLHFSEAILLCAGILSEARFIDYFRITREERARLPLYA